MILRDTAAPRQDADTLASTKALIAIRGAGWSADPTIDRTMHTPAGAANTSRPSQSVDIRIAMRAVPSGEMLRSLRR
jgi:hypothetical protein